jgi:ComF family protein
VVGRCPVCAIPSLGGAVCGACLSHPRHFDATCAPCQYAYPLDRLLQDYKYGGNLAVVPLLADLMLPVIASAASPDLVVAMPLSAERLRERGFNQSLELARALTGQTGNTLDPGALVRVRHTALQSELPWNARAKNVRDAFVCMRDVRDLVVAIVDDVLTTGATMDEAARVLKARGARRVIAWVAARTI